MPTYVYACTDCGHQFEQVQAFTDPSLTECPVCGGKLRKVFNSVGIVFKGSGFYRNDSRDKVGAGKSSADSSSDSSTASGDGSKTADKPAATNGDKSAGKTAEKAGAGSSSSSSGSGSSGSGSTSSSGSGSAA